MQDSKKSTKHHLESISGIKEELIPFSVFAHAPRSPWLYHPVALSLLLPLGISSVHSDGSTATERTIVSTRAGCHDDYSGTMAPALSAVYPARRRCCCTCNRVGIDLALGFNSDVCFYFFFWMKGIWESLCKCIVILYSLGMIIMTLQRFRGSTYLKHKKKKGY